MRKFVLILLAALMLPGFTSAGPKHLKGVHEKMSEHNHKKRMKQAKKESPGAAKHSLLHHKK
jgi:hypothetical protein